MTVITINGRYVTPPHVETVMHNALVSILERLSVQIRRHIDHTHTFLWQSTFLPLKALFENKSERMWEHRKEFLSLLSCPLTDYL